MPRDKIKLDLLIHDLKVPLSVIEAGIASMLKRRDKYGPLTDKQEKVLNRALRNTKRTMALVNDALELGRSGEGIMNLSRFKLSSLIEQSLVELFDLADNTTSDEIKSCSDFLELKGKLEQIGVYLAIDENLWCQEVSLDLAKMNQILRNLLTNALKYRRKRVEVGVRKDDGRLVISVKDDGEGIPSDFHKKIFECYFQMDKTDSCPVRGHGLGLAGVMVLVEDIGGKLHLVSDAGKGAEFMVEIPL
jgi:two-component system OmpR family sensor kinase